MKSKRKKITLKEYAEDKAALRISYHEKVCAERMKTLFKAIDAMRKDISELKTFMNRGKGAAAIIILIGGLVFNIVLTCTGLVCVLKTLSSPSLLFI